jgi:hypothetical protein
MSLARPRISYMSAEQLERFLRIPDEADQDSGLIPITHSELIPITVPG